MSLPDFREKIENKINSEINIDGYKSFEVMRCDETLEYHFLTDLKWTFEISHKIDSGSDEIEMKWSLKLNNELIMRNWHATEHFRYAISLDLVFDDDRLANVCFDNTGIEEPGKIIIDKFFPDKEATHKWKDLEPYFETFSNIILKYDKILRAVLYVEEEMLASELRYGIWEEEEENIDEEEE